MTPLRIGDVPAPVLAEEYDTPLYVYDADRIRANYTRLRDAFTSRYSDTSIHYAVKANSNPAIVNLLLAEGAGVDCGSPFEVELARRCGAEPRDVLYTGAYNRGDELEAALEAGATVNLDHHAWIDELPRSPDRLSFRVNPGIGDGKHGLVFAGDDAKFGVPGDAVVDAYRAARERGVERFGIHMMTGSCVLDPAYFERITRELVAIAGRVHDELGIRFDFVDIGGGLGVPYRSGEDPLDIEDVAERVTTAFREGVAEHNLGDPTLILEPGRYLVADAGTLLTQVTGVKEAGKTFVGVDTGMHHLLRPMLLDAHHHITVADDTGRPVGGKKTVVGPVCSSTDVLAEGRALPPVERGDLLAVHTAGAYGYTMASNWNTRARPAEVLVDNGGHRLIRRRERFEELFRGTALDQG